MPTWKRSLLSEKLRMGQRVKVPLSQAGVIIANRNERAKVTLLTHSSHLEATDLSIDRLRTGAFVRCVRMPRGSKHDLEKDKKQYLRQ